VGKNLLGRKNAVIKNIYKTNKILKKSIAQSVRRKLGKKLFGLKNGDETHKNSRENDQANIGVVRYDFGKTDLHPQIAEGDGRTLISIGG
jgi:hypothetical protein